MYLMEEPLCSNIETKNIDEAAVQKIQKMLAELQGKTESILHCVDVQYAIDNLSAKLAKAIHDMKDERIE